MKSSINGFCLPVLLIFHLILFTPSILLSSPSELKINKISRENIELISIKKGFRKNVFIQAFSGERNYYMISYSSFEKIKNVEISIFDTKKNKFVNYPYYCSDYNRPDENFYSSTKVKEINIPAKSYFRLSYEVESTEIMLLHDIVFYSPTPVDTFYFQISVPEDINLNHKIRNNELMTYLKCDSVSTGDGYSLQFTGTTVKTKTYNNNDRILNKVCRINLIATPIQLKNYEKVYFNDWFLEKISPTTVLNYNSKKFIDSITSGIKDQDSIIKVLYYFCRDEIKYIAIEVGYGSFIPGNVNDILKKRQGDCKDKGNFLCTALRYKGIKSNLAVTSSLDNENNMDFPSISNGNHVITVVKLNDSSMIFLDPTDKGCGYGHTGGMTQGQKAFIIDAAGGSFITIPILNPEKNLEKYSFDLTQKGGSISGVLTIEFSGIPCGSMTIFLEELPPLEKESRLKDYLNSNLKNVSFQKVSFNKQSDKLIVKAQITLGDHLFTTIEDKNYLSFDFLPLPIIMVNENPLPGDLLLYHSVNIQAFVTLKTDKKINSCNSPEFNYESDDYKFRMSSNCKNDILSIGYEFIFPNPIIEKNKSEQYHKFKNYVNKSFNNAVRLQ